MAAKYTVFTSGNCQWCTKAINLMANLGLDVVVISIVKNPKAITVLQERNLKTVPQIFVEEELIGGYEAFLRYAKEKGLIKIGKQ